MPTETLSPARAARQVGVPGNTLRLWCRTYGEFLSETANPAAGVERQITSGDVEVLKAIAALRANDVPPETIKQRLRDNMPDALQHTAIAPTTPATASTTGDKLPTVPTTPSDSHDAIQRFLERTEVLDSIKDVDRRLERLEHRNNTVIIAAVAFAAGAVVVGVIAWIVSMLR